MGKQKTKTVVDIVSMLLLIVAIITGVILHRDVWHLHVYDARILWGLHECAGLGLVAFIAAHCWQHSFWFTNYFRIKPVKKRVTTVLLALGVIVALSGIPLMLGSHSEGISHIHFAAGILFAIISVGHIAKRWKILKSLL